MSVVFDFREKGISALAEWHEWMSCYVEAAGGNLISSSYRISPERRALLRQEEVVWQSEDSDSLLPVADWHLTRDWAEQLFDRYAVCHAAALERDERALLLAGGPEAGKSTLALALVRRGFRYLSDEFAIVDPTTLEALPFPNALSIKDVATAKFEPTDPHFEVVSYPEGFWQHQEDAACGVPSKKIVPQPGSRFPVQWIVFLKDGPVAPARVPRLRAVLALYSALGRTEEASFRAVVALARKADLWEIGRSSMEEMADSITRITNPEQAQPG